MSREVPPSIEHDATRDLGDAVRSVARLLDRMIDGPDKGILDVVRGPRGKTTHIAMSQQELQVVRWALGRVLEGRM